MTQVGKTSPFIGPFLSSAIIIASGNNNNMPFTFLFGLYVPFQKFLWMLHIMIQLSKQGVIQYSFLVHGRCQEEHSMKSL